MNIFYTKIKWLGLVVFSLFIHLIYMYIIYLYIINSSCEIELYAIYYIDYTISTKINEWIHTRHHNVQTCVNTKTKSVCGVLVFISSFVRQLAILFVSNYCICFNYSEIF